MKETILLDPYPRSFELLFTKEQQARLRSMAEIKLHEGERMPDEMVDRYIGAASVVIGQTSLPRERLERGIHVLGVGGAYAEAVAEISPGESPSTIGCFVKGRRSTAGRQTAPRSCCEASGSGSSAMATSGGRSCRS